MKEYKTVFDDEQQSYYENDGDDFNAESYMPTGAEQSMNIESNNEFASDENTLNQVEGMPNTYGNIDVDAEDFNNVDALPSSADVDEINNNLDRKANDIPNIIPSSEEQNELQKKTTDIDIGHDGVDGLLSSKISFKGKACPTRHGCSGATDCDYAGGDYPF